MRFTYLLIQHRGNPSHIQYVLSMYRFCYPQSTLIITIEWVNFLYKVSSTLTAPVKLKGFQGLLVPKLYLIICNQNLSSHLKNFQRHTEVLLLVQITIEMSNYHATLAHLQWPSTFQHRANPITKTVRMYLINSLRRTQD